MISLRYFEPIGRYSYFVLRAIPATIQTLGRPVPLLVQLHTTLLGALPLGLVTGLALGIVVWIHMHGVLPPQYESLLPEYLALAVIVEFAPLSAGLIVAGRMGASLGAELGSMRQTEQIDALEVLGLSPMHRLVGPRVMACVLTLPLLTIVIAYVSILSSLLAEWMGGGMSWALYKSACLKRLTLTRLIPANLKTTVLGFLVGVTGCYHGMHATGGTEGVGKAATQGVVMSIFVVMVSNVVLVQLISVIFGR